MSRRLPATALPVLEALTCEGAPIAIAEALFGRTHDYPFRLGVVLDTLRDLERRGYARSRFHRRSPSSIHRACRLFAITRRGRRAIPRLRRLAHTKGSRRS